MGYIEREAVKEKLSPMLNDPEAIDFWEWQCSEIDDIPDADVRPVVFCRDCGNYVESEEANGEKMCVRDADWSVEDGCYYGFTEYPPPDWFCADGKKREES